MSDDDRKRIEELCALIAEEKDHKKLLPLVEELNRLLATRRRQEDKKARIVDRLAKDAGPFFP
jgi:hypothetical protein